MAVTAARLRAVVTADTGQGQKGLQDFGRQVTETRMRTNRELGGIQAAFQGLGAASKLLAPLGIALSLPALFNFSKDAAYAASDLSESYSKVGVVFRETAAEIERFARSSTTTLGMSRTAAYSAAGTFGNLFTTMGLGRQQAADMSKGLTQLAADLASFNNIDPSVALSKLQSGIVGQAEPLRSLGINLTAAATETKALELGLVRAGETLTESAAVTARYALIMEQSTNAQGDFARTADGLANASRIAAGEVADLKANLGKLVEKPYTAVVRVVAETVGKVNEAIETAPVRQAEARLTAARMQTDAYREWELISQALTDAERRLGEALLFGNAAMIEREQAIVAELQAEAAAAQMAVEHGDASTVLAEVLLRVAQGAYDAADGERGFVGAASQAAAAAWAAAQEKGRLAEAAQRAAWGADDVYSALAKLRDQERNVMVNAVAAGVLAGKISEATVEMYGLTAAYDMLQRMGTNPFDDMKTAIAAAEQQMVNAKRTAIARAVAEGLISKGAALTLDTDTAYDIVQDREARLKESNKRVASDYQRQMARAMGDLAREFESAMSKAQQFSIGLNDMRPGGAQGELAPGANGPFEDLYRLQAWLRDGSWSEVAQQYGLDQAGAADVVRKFQTGMWDDTVMAIVDKDQLKEQIRAAQIGQTLRDAVVADLASAGNADPALVKGLLGLGGSGTTPQAALDFGGDAALAIVAAFDRDLLANGREIEDRGGAAWDALEKGIVERAKESQALYLAFKHLAERAIEEALIS